MPYSKVSELPDGVKNNLPIGAQRIYLSAFNSAYEGTCKESSDKDACASKIAWSAVKNAYSKKDGKWVKKKSEIAELSFHITKAVFDKSSGEMRWAATASDTDPDLSEESMSLELFKSFIDKIERNVTVPEKYASEAWKGGMPYVSVAHYDALDGKGIVGDTNSIYVDGKMLKAKGTFRDTELGRACFKSVCKSIYDGDPDPVRISIAFLDMKHSHSDFIFERNDKSKMCPLCLRGIGEKVYLDGQLIHLALTRIPMNPRTDIEPDEVLRSESMTTRKQDAESIIGEELAEELERESQLVGKSEAEVEDDAVVIKSEDVEDTQEETVEEEAEEELVEESDTAAPEVKSLGLGGATSIAEARQYLSEQEETQRFLSEFMTFDEVMRNLYILNLEGDPMDLKRKLTELVLEFAGVLEANYKSLAEGVEKSKSDLDLYFEQIKSTYETVKGSDEEVNDKLMILQEPMNDLGEFLKSSIESGGKQPPVQEENEVVKSVEKAISNQLKPFLEQLNLLEARMDEKERQEKRQEDTPPIPKTVIPEPRSISPLLIKASQSTVPTVKPNSLRDIARRSTGLQSNYNN